MNAFGHVFDLNPVFNLAIGVIKIRVFGIVEMLLLESPHKTLGISVLGRLTGFGHAYLDVPLGEASDIASGGVLNALVGVMNLRCSVSQRLFECGQGQRLAQAASQMPTAYRTGEHIQHNSQIDEALAQLNISEVSDPNVVGATGLSTDNPIGVARQFVLTLGGDRRFDLSHLAAVPQLVHETAHRFAVDRQSLPLQLGRHLAIAIEGPVPDDPFYGRCQHSLIALAGLVVVAAARTVQRLTQPLHRIVGFKPINHRPFPFQLDPSKAPAFFRISSSKVWRPTNRSNSAIRSTNSRSAWCPLFSNTSDPLLKNSCFQRDTRFSLISRSRQICAALFSPRSASITVSNLNCPSNVRRFLRAITHFPPVPVRMIDFLSPVSKFWGALHRHSKHCICRV